MSSFKVHYTYEIGGYVIIESGRYNDAHDIASGKIEEIIESLIHLNDHVTHSEY